MFKKILVANRGEIALRVIRACRDLGVQAVAVYSDADRDALHVRAADEAFRLGPPPAAQSYLDVERILEVAASAGCDAIHPGYGFLAENAAFARACAGRRIAFIGPSAEAIERMGDKIAARAAAKKAGMPIVPGTIEPIRDASDVKAFAKKFGYPIAVKASAGGGGKGLKVARSASEVDQAISLARAEAAAYFKEDTLYLERYLSRPKHVEVQVLCDRHGGALHFGERDCSMQRRHQKLVEETPAHIDAQLRAKLTAGAVKLVKSIGYDSAGTVECLVEGDEFFFLEMNTRIQVEHTITEATWGIDLVSAQVRIAAGEALWIEQRETASRGHAIECRINAESPALDFRPCAGTLTAYREPAGPGVRVDAAAYPGMVIPQEYDSLLGKLVTWGADADEARRRMQRALREYAIEGVDTTIPFLRLLLSDRSFTTGDYATTTVDDFMRSHADQIRDAYPATHGAPGAWQAPPSAEPLTVEVNDKRFVVRVHGLPPGGSPSAPARRTSRFKSPKKVVHDGAVVESPMHGIVAKILAAPGDAVRDGQVVAVIEAMKMMNEVAAHRPGTVATVDVAIGQTVETGAALFTLK